MPRRSLAALLLLLVAVPSASAATQDELLARFDAYGSDSAFLDQNPELLVVRLAALAQLQSRAQPAANLTALTLVAQTFDAARNGSASLASRAGLELVEAKDDLVAVREATAEVRDSPAQPLFNLLLQGVERILDRYITRLEAEAAASERTTDRIALLSGAAHAAQTINDAEDYARLTRAAESLQSAYDRDRLRADAALDRGRALQAARAPSAGSIDFIAHYASLLDATDDLDAAWTLYDAHGEAALAGTTAAVGDDLEAKTGRARWGVIGVLFAYDALLCGLLWAASTRVVEWARTRRTARLGDEMALEA